MFMMVVWSAAKIWQDGDHTGNLILRVSIISQLKGEGDATESVSDSRNGVLSDSESVADSKWGGKLWES